MAEQAVRSSGVPYTILRPSLIFGPGDGFFTTLCALVRYSIPVVPIAGDGGALFQPIAIDDVVRCIVLSLERGAAGASSRSAAPNSSRYEGSSTSSTTPSAPACASRSTCRWPR